MSSTRKSVKRVILNGPRSKGMFKKSKTIEQEIQEQIKYTKALASRPTRAERMVPCIRCKEPVGSQSVGGHCQACIKSIEQNEPVMEFDKI